MGRACTVCTHPEADAINAALEAGQTLRALAAQYGLSDSSLDRHARRNLFAKADARTEPAHDGHGTLSSTPARAETPEKKRSILTWVSASVSGFVGGYLLCFLQRNAVRFPLESPESHERR